jgi:N-carbamoylputrescine amidase
MKLTVAGRTESLSRVKPATRKPVRVALVQTRWHESQEEHQAKLNEGIELAASAGASIVFLPELTLSRYLADARPTTVPNYSAESLEDGATRAFAANAAAKHGVIVHASLYEYKSTADGRALNSAIMVHPNGTLLARTPKLHIPVTAGYYEDKYFEPGPADGEPYPVYATHLGGTTAKIGLPTCWDEWFPEVARNYSLRGAEILVYPTAIGSEPDHPEFDTEPLWRQVIVGNGIANGTFMVVPNRWGHEGKLNFYGSSFISDPYGRVLVQAAREGDEVLVADLDLDQRRDWLDLFPFLATRRPDSYSALTKPVVNPRGENGDGAQGGIAGEW